MEVVLAIGTSILSTIVGELVKPVGRCASYIFQFRSIIEDLNEESKNLRSKLEDMQHRVDTAKRDGEEIEVQVQRWIENAKNVVKDVDKMEEESKEKQSCLNWMQKYQLAKNAEKKKKVMLKLLENGQFNIISHPAALSQANDISSEEFVPFESNQRTFDKVIKALKDDKVNSVGLHGMGGVGKTTLAKAAAAKIEEEKIFNKVLMVVVSQTPDIKSIQGKMADFLNLTLKGESIEGRAAQLFKRLTSKEKILIILDDVWKKV